MLSNMKNYLTPKSPEEAVGLAFMALVLVISVLCVIF